MKFIYKKKINKKKDYLQTKENIKIPTLFLFFPYPSFSPLAFDISCKILKHTFSKNIIRTP